jgi:hypothetical protein
MKRLALLSCAFVTIAILARGASAATIAEENGWKQVYTVIPRFVDMTTVLENAKFGNMLPTFTNTIKSPADGKTYSFTIVGTDPTKKAATTRINYFPLAIRWHFPGGVVIDPTNHGCNDTVSVARRFFTGPLFTNVPNTSNGVTLPNTQTTDAFQIAEFYKYTKNSSYHVLLSSTEKSATVVDETAPAGSIVQTGACSGAGHDLGEIPIDQYDSMLQALILKYTKSASILPVVLSYNIVETAGGCCIIGYHSVLTNHELPQPYTTAAYTDAGVFSSIEDIGAWQNELGETFNDPYIRNQTPPWVYDETGCRTQFEVAEPLRLTSYALKENGFTYHPTELAYFSWFFGQVPSLGTGGGYSYKGTFTKPNNC